jgi:methyl-accepting chemotaxis protein
MRGGGGGGSWWRRRWPGRRPDVVPSAGTASAAEETGGADGMRRQVMTEIAAGKARIAACVDELKARTEREVLACGDVLSTIVDTVRDLIAETDRTVATSLERSERVTSRFVTEMRDDILAQEAAVNEVLRLAGGIESAIDAINGLAQSSHMLAINAQIEAARLGHQGRGVGVIADQMREMSTTVRTTADTVRSSIGAVRQGLPPVKERAMSMRNRTRSFIEVVAEQVRSASRQTDTGSAGSDRLDAVMGLSNTALSHLQFQDPLAQRLASIGADLEVVEGRVGRILDGETDLEVAGTDRSRALEPPAGEVVLF